MARACSREGASSRTEKRARLTYFSSDSKLWTLLREISLSSSSLLGDSLLAAEDGAVSEEVAGVGRARNEAGRRHGWTWKARS